jgi:hypothetical protein
MLVKPHCAVHSEILFEITKLRNAGIMTRIYILKSGFAGFE